MVLNLLSACKAEKPDTAIAAVRDDNAANAKIGSAGCSNWQVVSTI